VVGRWVFAPGTARAAVPDPSRVVVVSDPQVWLGGGTTDSEIDAVRCASMVAEGLGVLDHPLAEPADRQPQTHPVPVRVGAAQAAT